MDWDKLIEKESTKDYYKKLMDFVQQEYLTKKVFPKKEDIFRAFELTPFDQVKVIILGQDPYHDDFQAHGLAFSVQNGLKIPPSLRNIYSELLNDLGVMPSPNGDLTSWAKQGVLLLNTVLTVEAHNAFSHRKKGWEIFTDEVIKTLNEDDKPKVFVLWGNPAISKETIINNPLHLIIKSSHPSPLSARHSFFGSKVFSRINEFVLEHYDVQIDFTIS